MKIGIVGPEADAQCRVVRGYLGQAGVEVVQVESQGFQEGKTFSFDGQTLIYQGRPLADVGAWYLRSIEAPYPPVFRLDEQYYLYRDWLIEYMRRRERYGFELSWLHYLAVQGVPVINPPIQGGTIQFKPFQLAIARALDLSTPRTLISNDPEAVRNFVAETGDVVYKSSMGGGPCNLLTEKELRYLEEIRPSPVTFQECVPGTCVRLTLLGEDLLSSVLIPSDYVDYRLDPKYLEGRQEYPAIDVPDDIVRQCLQLMQHCSLVFSGIDLILRPDQSWVFLEANPSPVYLDIEHKTGIPISEKLAHYLIRAANQPVAARPGPVVPSPSFVAYANPFDPYQAWGGKYDRPV